jgi:hypothetical protein
MTDKLTHGPRRDSLVQVYAEEEAGVTLCPSTRLRRLLAYRVAVRERRRTRQVRRAVLFELLWSCALFGIPLGTGLLINFVLGWWPGLATLLMTGLLIGIAAHRAGRRRPFR